MQKKVEILVKSNVPDTVKELVDEILKIPGPKIVTLTNVDRGIFRVDINEQGVFGYETGVKELFMAKLVRALHEGGGLIIRQFLPIKVKRANPKGEEMWLPEKYLYGIMLKDNKWFGMSPETLEDCCNQDANTGLPLPPEEGIHYQSFPIVYETK
jgi:hypothetical protein